jgi:hypothetical protein
MAVEVNRFQSPMVAPQFRGPTINRVETRRAQAPVTAAITYVMRGQDHATNGLYDTWKSTNAPDFTGTLYTGALATPLRDIVVQSKG